MQEAWQMLEARREYSTIQNTIEKILVEQWNDVVMSGMINTVFSKYKNFFRRKRGVTHSIKKAAEDIKSLTDLKEQEQDTMQQDRFVIGENSLDMKKLTAFLALLILANLKGFGSYYQVRSQLRDYLKGVSNKAGQSILDEIDLPKNISFRLSNSLLKSRISQRVNELVKSLDETTKNKLIKELIKGISNGETKTQLVRRLEEVGKDQAKYRAKMIAKTETQGVYEYMRYETAYTNGASMKTWTTAGIEGTCPLCRALDGVTIPINQNFRSETFTGKYPPAHPNCACSVHYDMEGNSCSNWVKKSRGLGEDIEDLFYKVLYKPEVLTDTPSRCVNPNAIWAGGEGLIGKDRAIGEYYNDVMRYQGTGVTLESVVNLYREKLTDEGFVQLRLKFGLKGKVMAKTP